jgi:hypothetical protein
MMQRLQVASERLTLRSLTDPASSMVNPACIKNTSIAALLTEKGARESGMIDVDCNLPSLWVHWFDKARLKARCSCGCQQASRDEAPQFEQLPLRRDALLHFFRALSESVPADA